MKRATLLLTVVCNLLAINSSPVCAAEGDKPKLDVLKMREIPSGRYDLQMQVDGESQSVKLEIKGSRASFVKSSSGKLESFSGQFEFIGNGVFMARFAGKNHRATQWWIFQPDGSAKVREVPDRGEQQTAKPASEK